MSSHCRLCHENGDPETETLIVCNNCGSHACRKHHSFWSRSKNAFCHECFPRQAGIASAQLETALRIMLRDFENLNVSESEIPGQIAERLIREGRLGEILRTEGPDALQRLIGALRVLLSTLEEFDRRGTTEGG